MSLSTWIFVGWIVGAFPAIFLMCYVADQPEIHHSHFADFDDLPAAIIIGMFWPVILALGVAAGVVAAPVWAGTALSKRHYEQDKRKREAAAAAEAKRKARAEHIAALENADYEWRKFHGEDIPFELAQLVEPRLHKTTTVTTLKSDPTWDERGTEIIRGDPRCVSVIRVGYVGASDEPEPVEKIDVRRNMSAAAAQRDAEWIAENWQHVHHDKRYQLPSGQTVSGYDIMDKGFRGERTRRGWNE